ncbi:hypothetical protein GW17_00056860 [Ensete ventricosum]|nr:hypothetical protein GW17_00056860 [Ensete ventricosum]
MHQYSHVVKNQHLLLCTLLIGNSLAMEVSAAPLLSSVCPRIVGAKTAGLLLDWLLGKGHFALMRRAELKTLVDMHGNESFLGFQAGKGGELTHDETTIITGALDLTQKTAKDAMTTILETFSLDINSKLDMYVVLLINKLLMLRNIVNLYLLSGTLWV